MRPDTVLSMAACTKLMTAIAVLQSVEWGLFDLDEDVAGILPELKDVEIISTAEWGGENPMLRQKRNTITPR